MATVEIVEPVTAFADISFVSRTYALASLGRAAYTLFATPEHEKLHNEMEAACMDGPFQPLQVSVAETVRGVSDEVLPKYDIVRPPATDAGRLIHMAGVLIQFSDYIPKMHATIRAQYGPIKELHQELVDRAARTQPLGFADQFDVALEQGNGNLIESMWRLFIASRLHARWLDGRVIEGMPELSKEEKITEMLAWRTAITACKLPDPNHAQDPNGDNYYAWTHALAKVVYSLAPERESAATHATVNVFEQGTNLMHKIVHTFNKQGVESNHRAAANYGNTIGQCIVDYVKR